MNDWIEELINKIENQIGRGVSALPVDDVIQLLKAISELKKTNSRLYYDLNANRATEPLVDALLHGDTINTAMRAMQEYHREAGSVYRGNSPVSKKHSAFWTEEGEKAQLLVSHLQRIKDAVD